MNETNTQMRRSISMPVKPLHLEPKTLKRSAEKETVYATDDSETEDNAETNYLRQRSSPSMHSDNIANCNDSNNTINETESTTLRGLPKHLRSVRESLASLVNPLFSIFRRPSSIPNDNDLVKSDQCQRGSYNVNSSEDHSKSEHPKMQVYRLTPSIERKLNEMDKTSESESNNGSERVTFSL